MEKIIDFDEWIKNFVIVEPDYYAIYDKKTGVITGVYPEGPAKNLDSKIKITKEFAESIIDGSIPMHHCYVDLSSDSLEIIQVSSLKKIDDILHRIIEKKYSDIETPDLLVNYFRESGTFKFILSEEIRIKRVKWDGDTELKFIISQYNDPHKILDVISFTLDHLYENDLEFKITLSEENFSVFTRRIFKKYVIDTK